MCIRDRFGTRGTPSGDDLAGRRPASSSAPSVSDTDRLPGHLLRQSFCVVVVQDVWLVLSHLLGELWAGRGVPGWSALGFGCASSSWWPSPGCWTSRSSAGTGDHGYSMSLSRKSIPPVAEVTASWVSAWPSGLLSAATDLLCISWT